MSGSRSAPARTSRSSRPASCWSAMTRATWSVPSPSRARATEDAPEPRLGRRLQHRRDPGREGGWVPGASTCSMAARCRGHERVDDHRGGQRPTAATAATAPRDVPPPPPAQPATCDRLITGGFARTRADGSSASCEVVEERLIDFCASGGSSSVGRAAAFQAACREFEPRLPLHSFLRCGLTVVDGVRAHHVAGPRGGTSGTPESGPVLHSAGPWM